MVKIQEAIYHGIIAADFLCKTKRLFQAIELWNECLILLNNKSLQNEHELAREGSIELYWRLFYGNISIKKLSPAIESGKKLLVLLRNCDRKKEESETALNLSTLYLQTSKYKESQSIPRKGTLR